MKKYILFVLLALCSLSGFAQSSMTDTQVMDFVQKEHKKGTPQAQIVTKLMQSGVDISHIRRVRVVQTMGRQTLMLSLERAKDRLPMQHSMIIMPMSRR